MATTEEEQSGFGWAQQPGGAQLSTLIAEAFGRAAQDDTTTRSRPASDDVRPGD